MRAVCTKLYVCVAVYLCIQFHSRLETRFLFLAVWIFSVLLPHCLPVSPTHSRVQRFAAEMLSAVLGSTRFASCSALIRAGG